MRDPLGFDTSFGPVAMFPYKSLNYYPVDIGSFQPDQLTLLHSGNVLQSPGHTWVNHFVVGSLGQSCGIIIQELQSGVPKMRFMVLGNSQWMQFANHPQAMSFSIASSPGACQYDGKLFTFGGRNGGSPSTLVYRFTNAGFSDSGTWSLVGNLTSSLYGTVTVSVGDGVAIIIGKDDDTGDLDLRYVAMKYNLVTNVCTPLSGLPAGTYSMGNVALRAIDGKHFFAGRLASSGVNRITTFAESGSTWGSIAIPPGHTVQSDSSFVLDGLFWAWLQDTGPAFHRRLWSMTPGGAWHQRNDNVYDSSVIAMPPIVLGNN